MVLSPFTASKATFASKAALYFLRMSPIFLSFSFLSIYRLTSTLFLCPVYGVHYTERFDLSGGYSHNHHFRYSTGSDPGRIAAQIVSSMGVLGAIVVLRKDTTRYYHCDSNVAYGRSRNCYRGRRIFCRIVTTLLAYGVLVFFRSFEAKILKHGTEIAYRESQK